MKDETTELLERIAFALEHRNGAGNALPPQWAQADAYVWQARNFSLKPVKETGALPFDLLVGIDRNADLLLQNTAQFAAGKPANNALLWGARGMGKSSLVKAAHAKLKKDHPLILIEIYREDLGTLPVLLDLLRDTPPRRFILFCDDLSFDANDSSYKSLKAVLEGGVEARPENVLFYATSNRRHLMPRDMIENERSTAIHASEAAEEKVSLSDRFGLWLGFYNCNQDDYLKMVHGYAAHFGLKTPKAKLDKAALEWATTRGGRSGRVAWQFIQDLRGKV